MLPFDVIDFPLFHQRGYTFVAEARTPNAILPAGKFRLRVIGSTEPLPFPGREGVNSHFVTKEIRDYYIPNKYNIIFRLDGRWNSSVSTWLTLKINCVLTRNPVLHPNISMHILHTVLYTFPNVLSIS